MVRTRTVLTAEFERNSEGLPVTKDANGSLIFNIPPKSFTDSEVVNKRAGKLAQLAYTRDKAQDRLDAFAELSDPKKSKLRRLNALRAKLAKMEAEGDLEELEPVT